MKQIYCLFILLFITVSLCFSQSKNILNGYKYVLVSDLVYGNGERDVYGICEKLRTCLVRTGFVVLSPVDMSNWPRDLIDNVGLVLEVSIDHGNRNGVSVVFHNCKRESVYQVKGRGVNWINDVGDNVYRSMERLCANIDAQINYKYDPSKSIKPEYPSVETTTENEQSIKQYLSQNQLDPIEGVYKSIGDGTYYKVGIKKHDDIYKVIILDSETPVWKKGEIKAYLENTSMYGIYSASYYMRDKSKIETFAELTDPTTLTIIFKDRDKTTSSKFIKLFPQNLKGQSKSISENKNIVKASGSGFVLTSSGFIGTNAHVVDGAEKLEVVFSNEVGVFTYNAILIKADNANDVAILKIDDEKFKGFAKLPYGLTEKTDIGAHVFTIGFPLNDVMGSNYKVTDGIISSTSGIKDDIRFYQISVPIQPGNSGGPLFNEQGHVIGLTTSRLNSKAVGANVENVNYAIKASYLMNLFKMVILDDCLSTESVIGDKKMEEKVKVLKNFVCRINIR